MWTPGKICERPACNQRLAVGYEKSRQCAKCLRIHGRWKN